MDELGNKKYFSQNGTGCIKEDSVNRRAVDDEVDGAICGKRQVSDASITDEPKTFEDAIPGKLDVGRMIKIQGAIPFGVEVFQINLCCEPSDAIALHISVRFKNRYVVRNTFQEGDWQTEEKDGPFPFSSGKEFCVLILVQSDSYHIAVNNQHCWTFAHRLPFADITALNVIGPVKIHDVEYPSIEKDQQKAHESSALSLQPVINPSVPFSYTIPGGIKTGMKICIKGRPFISVYRFTINLQCGLGPYPPPDIAFHFDVRAFNHTVVRNTRRNNNWEQEEVTAAAFPFQPGVNFDMIVSVEHDKYVVMINGNHYTEYDHRMIQLSLIDTLRIDSDIVVASIDFQ